MAQEEKYGTRCNAYSAWHRRMSIARFEGVGIEKAQTLAMIDIDAMTYVECHDKNFQPLFLVETALDVGQEHKPFTMTRNLALRCTPALGAWVVLYTLSDRPNPADEDARDIASFRVRKVAPEIEEKWTVQLPDQWARYLVKARAHYAGKLDAWLKAKREEEDARHACEQPIRAD